MGKKQKEENRSRTPSPSKSRGPGPGAYSLGDTLSKSPAFSISGKYESKVVSEGPGNEFRNFFSRIRTRSI